MHVPEDVPRNVEYIHEGIRLVQRKRLLEHGLLPREQG